MKKDIKGYEGLYVISDEGQVESLPRTIINKNGKKQYYPGKYLKMDRAPTGHSRVTLSKQHIVNRFFVHRLVAEAFIPNLDNKPHINHLDNDPTNNLVSNIEWVTHSENMLHAQKQGRLFLAQSKGGKTTGIAGIIAGETVKKLIGQKINNWTIISFAVYRGKKKYFNVICDCGNTVTREQSYLQNSKQDGCIKCKTRD